MLVSIIQFTVIRPHLLCLDLCETLCFLRCLLGLEVLEGSQGNLSTRIGGFVHWAYIIDSLDLKDRANIYTVSPLIILVLLAQEAEGRLRDVPSFQ